MHGYLICTYHISAVYYYIRQIWFLKVTDATSWSIEFIFIPFQLVLLNDMSDIWLLQQLIDDTTHASPRAIVPSAHSIIAASTALAYLYLGRRVSSWSIASVVPTVSRKPNQYALPHMDKHTDTLGCASCIMHIYSFCMHCSTCTKMCRFLTSCICLYRLASLSVQWYVWLQCKVTCMHASWWMMMYICALASYIYCMQVCCALVPRYVRSIDDWKALL